MPPSKWAVCVMRDTEGPAANGRNVPRGQIRWAGMGTKQAGIVQVEGYVIIPPACVIVLLDGLETVAVVGILSSSTVW